MSKGQLPRLRYGHELPHEVEDTLDEVWGNGDVSLRRRAERQPPRADFYSLPVMQRAKFLWAN